MSFNWCVLQLLMEYLPPYNDYYTAMQNTVTFPAHTVNLNVNVGYTQESQRQDNEVYYVAPPPNAIDSVNPFDPLGTSTPDVTAPYAVYLEAGWAAGGWIASAVDLMRIELAESTLLNTQALADRSANPGAYWCTRKNTGCDPARDIDPTTGAIKTGIGGLVSTGCAWWGLGWEFYTGKGNCAYDVAFEKYGGFDGTSTYLARGVDGSNWTMLINTQDDYVAPPGADPYLYLDAAYNATVAANGFDSTQDLMDQYTNFGDWLSPATFQSQLTSQWQQYHRYAQRIEGRLYNGGIQYRAEFVVLKPNWTADPEAGLTCEAYKAKSTSNAAAGMQLSSLQWFTTSSGNMYQATWLKPSWNLP